MAGVPIRSDIVEAYVFRRGRAGSADVEFLQLRRARAPLAGSWQPVMGHVEPGESAVQAALRELKEETGYTAAHGIRAAWQLERVNTFFLAGENALMLSAGLAVEVDPALEPALDASHDAHRWTRRDHVDRAFLWPGQRQAVADIVRDLLPADSPVAAVLRIDPAAL